MLLLGLFFCAGIYPIAEALWHPDAAEDYGDYMMLSLYVTLGVFLLIAARNPSAHRSLIAFTAWSSFAHALVMGTMAFQFANQRAGFFLGFCRPRGHRRSPYRARAGKGVRRFRLCPCGLLHDNALRSSWSLHPGIDSDAFREMNRLSNRPSPPDESGGLNFGSNLVPTKGR